MGKLKPLIVKSMKYTEIYPLFLLGFLGTGHCLGMCGPLVFAFPGRTGRISAHWAYHMGRLTTYTAVGAILAAAASAARGLAGMTNQEALHMVSAVQTGISLLAAGFMFFFALQRLGIIAEPSWMAAISPARLPGRQHIFRSGKKSYPLINMYVTGITLGFIPCGLSYAAFTRALAADGIFSGGAMLLAFGMGTLPGLMFLGSGIAVIVRRYGRVSEILSGLLMIAMAAMLAADAFGAIMP